MTQTTPSLCSDDNTSLQLRRKNDAGIAFVESARVKSLRKASQKTFFGAVRLSLPEAVYVIACAKYEE